MSDSAQLSSTPCDLDSVVCDAAPALVDCALQVIRTKFPHKLGHIILDADDVRLRHEVKRAGAVLVRLIAELDPAMNAWVQAGRMA